MVKQKINLIKSLFATNHKDIRVFNFIKVGLIGHFILLVLILGTLVYLTKVRGLFFIYNWDLFIFKRVSFIYAIVISSILVYIVSFIVFAFIRMQSPHNGLAFILSMFLWSWLLNSALLFSFDLLTLPSITIHPGYYSIQIDALLVTIKPVVFKLIAIAYWIVFFFH